MMMVVESRRPRCWSCKQLGHISKFCHKKDPPNAAAATAITTATTTTTTITTATISSENKTPGKESDQPPPQKKTPRKAGPKWPKRGKKSQTKTDDKTAAASRAKNANPDLTSIYIPASVTAPIPPNITEIQFSQQPRPLPGRKPK